MIIRPTDLFCKGFRKTRSFFFADFSREGRSGPGASRRRLPARKAFSPARPEIGCFTPFSAARSAAASGGGGRFTPGSGRASLFAGHFADQLPAYARLGGLSRRRRACPGIGRRFGIGESPVASGDLAAAFFPAFLRRRKLSMIPARNAAFRAPSGFVSHRFRAVLQKFSESCLNSGNSRLPRNSRPAGPFAAPGPPAASGAESLRQDRRLSQAKAFSRRPPRDFPGRGPWLSRQAVPLSGSLPAFRNSPCFAVPCRP
jgi:hypothetical protein